ncbi:MAG TPA: SIS domain-containing protein [Candidatus Limnocylindrales bacterium]|nr:SIS domain-containing protein [Candidatus Limnocylindrales bacterium]
MTDRAAQFLADVLASPAAIREAIEAGVPQAAADLVRARPALVAGMGSSRFAALDALPHLRAAGVVARVELASVAETPPEPDATVLVAISSSGETREVLELARSWPGPVVGLTARPASRLAALATAPVTLSGVDETSGIACQGYRATLVRLLALGVPGVEERLAGAVAALDELVSDHAAWVGPAADVLDGPDEVHVIGSGRRPGLLEQAALMLREAPRIPALPIDTADWLHVGLYTMLPGGRALLLSGGPDDDEVVSTIAGRGGRTVAIGPAVEGAAFRVPLPERAVEDSLVRSLVEPVAVELIAAELWARTSAGG